MYSNIVRISFFASAMLALTLPCAADLSTLTYVYTGNNFAEDEVSDTGGIFTTNDRVTASFTVNCAKAHTAADCRNLPYDNYYALGAVDPASVRFSAGPARLPTQEGFANINLFSFSTDESGNIEGWNLDLSWPDPSGTINVDTDAQIDSVAALETEAVIMGRPGTWAIRDSVPDNGSIVIRLEEPVNGATHSGIGNLRGWSIAEEGISRVEIYIDGKYQFDVPYGGDRGDVGKKYPDIPGASRSGFSLSFGYSNLAAGRHTITARAINSLGDWNASTSTFDVVAFQKEFIQKSDTVDLTNSQSSSQGEHIFLQDVMVDDQLYNLILEWRTATQGFEIVEIR